MKVALTKLKNNPKNPRVIRDEKFNKLKKSIEDFPDMLEKRPLVVFTDKDGKYVVLGGNMRLKAAKELGIKELPVIVADEWTEEQKAQFLIKDNVNFGEWNHEELANEWDAIQLQEWGLDLPVNLETEDIDYSILDEDDLGDKLQEMQDGVKKAIQIEFEAEHYEDAFAVVKFWREQGAYVGKMILDYLKSEKEKL
jgi:ParB-like chromosome segregation protein Spo0J